MQDFSDTRGFWLISKEFDFSPRPRFCTTWLIYVREGEKMYFRSIQTRPELYDKHDAPTCTQRSTEGRRAAPERTERPRRKRNVESVFDVKYVGYSIYSFKSNASSDLLKCFQQGCQGPGRSRLWREHPGQGNMDKTDTKIWGGVKYQETRLRGKWGKSNDLAGVAPPSLQLQVENLWPDLSWSDLCNQSKYWLIILIIANYTQANIYGLKLLSIH